MLVECNHFYFLAVAKRALFSEYEVLAPEELFLGNGCPPTRVQTEELHFRYPITFCGIVKEVRSNHFAQYHLKILWEYYFVLYVMYYWYCQIGATGGVKA